MSLRSSAALTVAITIAACAPAAVVDPTPTVMTSAPAATQRPSATVRALRTPQPRASVVSPDLVLSYERFSDIPITTGPQLLLTSDGQLLSADADRAVMSRRLSAAGVELLRRAAIDTGLFTETRSIGRQPRPGATPQLNRGFESLRITVRAGDRTVAVSTFARDPEDALYVWEAGRDELLALADRLADLAWLPPSAWDDRTGRPYVAIAHRLYVELLRGSAQPGLPGPVEGVWPFTVPADAFGETVPRDPAWSANVSARCAILAAEDARALGEPVARGAGATYRPELRVTSGGYAWTAGSGEVYLQLEPLLPHASPSCAGVRRLV